MNETRRDDREPKLSMIMPCYNEEEVIGYTIPRLVHAFDRAGHPWELVACDNGSSDRTGEIIAGFIEQGMPIVCHRVEVNEGYGNGVLRTVPVCRAPWIGIIPCDGQVDAEDVVRLFESVMRSDGRVVGKVRRRFRMDGPFRAVVSLAYNLVMLAMWPNLGSIDVNGSPKIIHRDALKSMKIQSTDWLLDAELMIKAQHMDLRTMEMNVFARMREHGESHVQASTCWEFIKRLIEFRFGSAMSSWLEEFRKSGGLPGRLYDPSPEPPYERPEAHHSS